MISLDAVHAADPDTPFLWAACSLCRQGDLFLASYAPLTGTGHYLGDGFISSDVHLYAGDQELPRTPFQDLGTVLPLFTLPKGPGTYRLVQNDPAGTTTWRFTSPGTATKDAVQPGYACLLIVFGNTDPCQPEPTIFLNYDLGDSLQLDITSAGK